MSMEQDTGKPRLQKAVSAGTLPTYGYLLRIVSILAGLLAFSLLMNVIQGFVLHSRSEVKPWVIDRRGDGSMATVAVNRPEVTAEQVFEFVSYIIPRLYLVEGGTQPGLDSIKYLVDRRIIEREVAAFQKSQALMLRNKVAWQASTVRLLIGTPDKRTFVISKKFGVVRAMVEGRSTIVSTVRNTSDPIRWDVELEIIAPTANNLWGLRLVRIYASALDAAPIDISDLLI